METKIKWNTGTGYITVTYEGSGNEEITIKSDRNWGTTRTQDIIIRSTDGTLSQVVTITQKGTNIVPGGGSEAEDPKDI